MEVTRLFAEEVADRIVDDDGHVTIKKNLSQILDNRRRFMGVDRNLILIVKDEKGEVIFSRQPPALPPPLQLDIPRLLREADKSDKVKSLQGDTLYVIKKDLDDNGKSLGTVILLFPETDIKVGREQLQYLVIMLGSLGLLGWAVIYFHSRKLSEPIQDVVLAARQIVDGNYDVRIDKSIKEREIHELVYTFKEMADRLRQLESTRTELLAGVTHELKTPVTCISGLVQAINDEVVTGAEEKEFLKICLKETKRLEKMVEDLLDFNSLAVGDISVHLTWQDLNSLILGIGSQWDMVQEGEAVRLEMKVPERTIHVMVDPSRMQQILVNLLNNARAAVQNQGVIEVTLYETAADLRIDVTDSGHGIPPEEQRLVFERFFRGRSKKNRVRGLGLGLPFSRMIAKALGGDLVLGQSSPEGSTFTLILPKPIHAKELH